MSIHNLEASIVVAGADCNPSILNPDFLSIRGVVPEAWKWSLAGPAITTPPLATLSYDSGVSITVETNKFQVVDSLRKEIKKNRIEEIACKYIEVLPHVRYSAVGHNFRSLIENSDAEAFIKARFLKAGVWDDKPHHLLGMGLKFVYPQPESKQAEDRIVMSIDGAIVHRQLEGTTSELKGLLVSVNFHRKCSDYPAEQQVKSHIKHFKEDWDHYQKLISEILV